MSSRVSTTESGYSAGVTSAIQTQLDSKAAFPLVTSQSLGSPFTINSHTITDTGLSLSITTTRANEKVLVTFTGHISEDSGSAHTPVLSIQLDSDTSIEMNDDTIPASFHANFSFSYWLNVSTAAAHTIKLRANNLENITNASSIPTSAVFSAAQW